MGQGCSALHDEGQLGKSAGVDKRNVASHPEGTLQSSPAKKKKSHDLKALFLSAKMWFVQ